MNTILEDESLSQEARAAQLILQRRAARRDLVEWSRLCGFEPARHHRLLISKLEAVSRGEVRRLMVFMPPGSAKSSYGSVLFPPWFLAQRKCTAILTASHSAHLAATFGKRCRNLILDHENDLGYGLAADSQAADEWNTTTGCEFFCAGVGGRISGRRADLGLIDDPFGSRDDAYSETMREGVWNWYKFDFRTRLKPGAAIVLINTRYHDDDLAGRLLKEEGKEWEVVCLPFIAKKNDPLGRVEGERLWKEYFDDKIEADARKDSTVFYGPYQQEPAPESGDFFKAEWLDACTYEAKDLPKNLRYYGASDHAVRTDEANDTQCLLTAGVDSSDVIWLLPDVFWDRADTGVVVDEMLRLMKRYKHSTWWAGKDHISGAIGPFLNKRMREEKCYVYIEELPNHNRRKRELATAIQGRIKMGMVRFPRFAPWWHSARTEMLSFDAGKHDDFVDALGCLGRGLDSMLKGPAEKVEVPLTLKPTEMTLEWLHNSDKWRKRQHRFSLIDN